MKKMLERLLRVVIGLGLFLTFFYFANLSLYHAWAGSFPAGRNFPEKLKEWHLYWADVFSSLAVFFLSIFAVYGGWNVFRWWKKGPMR